MNKAFNIVDVDTRPSYIIVVTWIALIATLRLAGAVFSSTQDNQYGSMLTASSSSAQMPDTVFSYLTYLIMAVLVSRSSSLIIRQFKKHLIISALCGFTIVSSIWSQAPLVTFRAAVTLTLMVAFTYWLVTKFNVGQIMQLFMLTGAAAAVLSIIVIVLLPSKGLDTLHDGAWQGVFSSKNHMGRIFVFLLTPAIHYPVRSLVGRWMRGGYVCLMLLMIFMSASISSWIVLLLYCVFAFAIKAINQLSRRSALTVLFIVLPAIMAICGMAFGNLALILKLFNRDPTLTHRTQIWSILLTSIGKRPLFGFGYQAFWTGGEAFTVLSATYATMHFLGEYAHSGYFSVLLEMGACGLILIAILMIQGFRDALRCLSKRRTPYINWYISLLLLTLVYNIDEVTMMLPAYLPWLMCLLAVVGLSNAARRLHTVEAAEQC